MKKSIIIAVLAVFILAWLYSVGIAGAQHAFVGEGVTDMALADKPKPVTYEVKIDITWNAVTSDKVLELINDVMAKQSEACKVAVKVKKNGAGDWEVVSGTSVWSVDEIDAVQLLNTQAQ